MNLPTHSHHLCCFFNCIGLVSGTRTPNLNPVHLKGAYTGSQNTRRGCGVNSGKGSNATKLKKSWSQASNTSKTPSPFLVLLHPLSAQTCVRKHGCLWPLNFVALYFLLLKPKRILTHLGSGVHSQTNQHGQEQDLFKYLAAPEVALGIYWRAIPRRWVEPSRNPETSSCQCTHFRGFLTIQDPCLLHSDPKRHSTWVNTTNSGHCLPRRCFCRPLCLLSHLRSGIRQP